MSEKEKEIKEELTLHHFYHEHPLTLTPAKAYHGYDRCYGCRRFISDGETVYQCRRCLYPKHTLDHFYHHHPLILSKYAKTYFGYEQCYGCRRYISDEQCYGPILHEECAEMPREITLSLHPQHTLIQKVVSYRPRCAVCEKEIYRIGYCCSSSDSCKFQIHVGCAQSANITHAAAGGGRSCMQHPSHPQHELTLLRRPLSFRCDACDTVQRGNSYVCIVCHYLIHDPLPHRLHEHPLSLVYCLPLEYIKWDYKCDVCCKELLPKYWVYHCGICRYVVHINCAIGTSPATTSNIDEDRDLITFPVNNAVEELIRPFVMKFGDRHENENEMVKAGKYKFHNPDHQLRLISSSSLRDQEEEEEEEDCDDDLNYGKISKLVCDGCTAPLFLKTPHESLNEDYMSCGECKYFLHLPCFNLPSELLSHPLHQYDNHTLTLQIRPKLDFIYCSICRVPTNGLYYECTKCDFKADIKCASLPDAIKHAAHPHPRLKLLTKENTREESYLRRACDACGCNTYNDVCYKCDVCQIILHAACCLLPAAVTNPTWDKHPMPLTFDATANHPSSFYCEVCEEEMNPKRWMYHCRRCDVSVHPYCFPTASGKYRNIKFGQRYLIDALHHHPLTYQLLTTKLHCDVCNERKRYGKRGFQCCSDECDFFMCLKPCGRDHEGVMQVVD